MDEVKVLCLFTLICFGQRKNDLTMIPGCDVYDYQGDTVSLKCVGSASFSSLQGIDIHTLALTSSSTENSGRDLGTVRFKHLILQDFKISESSHFQAPSNLLEEYHHSLTAIRSENLEAWPWSYFRFRHIHVESSSLVEITGGTPHKSVILGGVFPAELLSLYLIDCRLNAIADNSLSHLTLLQTLTISGNNLKSFQRAILPEKMANLWLIDLSHNHLEIMDPNFSRGMPALTELNLKSNRLKILPWEGVKLPWFQLNLIQLFENDWSCETFCWAYDQRTFPHPLFFDSTSCLSKNTQSEILGSTSKISLGCVKSKSKRCLTDFRPCKIFNKVIICSY